MTARRLDGIKTDAEGLKYALPRDAKATDSLDFSSLRLGQMNPQHCPYQEQRVSERCPAETLGQPMNIHQVAALLGCSVWTVRQRYLPIGLPYFRIGSAGKLMFYRNQIVRWVLEKQGQKGGEIR